MAPMFFSSLFLSHLSSPRLFVHQFSCPRFLFFLNRHLPIQRDMGYWSQHSQRQRRLHPLLLRATRPGLSCRPRVLPLDTHGAFLWNGLALESRGPGIDPFRASCPKWARKWPKNGFWPHQKNGGKMAWKMEKMARKMEKMARNGSKMEFRAIFPIFRAMFPPFFGQCQNPFSGHFRPHFGPEARNGSFPGPRDYKARVNYHQISGKNNPAFSKPCLSDTRHFVIFVVFGGLRSETLVFSPCTPAEARQWIFFDFSKGNLENLVGNLEGIFWGFFWPTEQRLKKFGENFGAFFVRKFVARKKSFVQNSLCRRATLIVFSGENRFCQNGPFLAGDTNQEALNVHLANVHFDF